MILTAHQVGYLPWLGFFHKLAMADQFCVFDDVQYEKKAWNNRNYIKTQNGPQLLTVPTYSKNHYDIKLKDTRICYNTHWQRKHIRAIELAYRKAPYFDKYFNTIAQIIDGTHEYLIELNTSLAMYIAESMGLNSQHWHYASLYEFQGTKSELVLDMCKTLGATIYIFGGEGKNYADELAFRRFGVMPVFQEFQHPVYDQLHGAFAPNMSALDLLFNHGPDSYQILTGEGSPPLEAA